MPRLKDVRINEVPKNRPTKVLTIDAQTAGLLRRVARADGLGMSAFLDRCLRAYLEKTHPDWELVDDVESAAPDTQGDLRAATRGQKGVFGGAVGDASVPRKTRRR